MNNNDGTNPETCRPPADSSQPEANMTTASERLTTNRASSYSWRVSYHLSKLRATLYVANLFSKVPSPPHIHIPTRRDDSNIILPEYQGIGSGDNTDDDLGTIVKGNHVATPFKEWMYEQRRVSQRILPFLYLGPASAARDISTLQSQGITMLLAVRDAATAHARLLSGEKVAAQLGIEAAAVDINGNQGLIAAFPQAIQIINSHLTKIYRQESVLSALDEATTWGKILVFCESGNERSACVVAAYLMYMYNMDLVTAIQYIQCQRFCVAYDDGLKNLLLSYQQILEAQKSVSQARMQNPPLANQTANREGKRGRDNIKEEDVAMDPERADDEARFVGRSGFVPFFD